MDIQKQLKSDNKYTVRTQISLSKTLKQYVDYLSKQQEKSISQIIRESLIESSASKAGANLALSVFLNSSDTKNKNWKTLNTTEKWIKNLRKDK